MYYMLPKLIFYIDKHFVFAKIKTVFKLDLEMIFKMEEMIMAKYKTNQKKVMLEYLENRAGQHVTANDIKNYFSEINAQIGLTTIYRHLNQLVDDGLVKKFFIDESSGSCFEYVQKECAEHEHEHFHLKCEQCDTLIHFDCHEIEELQKHIQKEHGFTIDPIRTVFYGLCEKCAKRHL